MKASTTRGKKHPASASLAGDSIVLDQPEPIYLGDNITFTCVNTTPVPAGGRLRCGLYAIDLTTGALLCSDALNVVDGKAGPFIMGGAASRWTEQGGPAHCIGDFYIQFDADPNTPLATTELDSPGVRP